MKLSIAVLLAVIAPTLFAGSIYDVTIDTTPLAGVNGFLAFDLLGGNPFQNNVVTISIFATTGTLGSASSSGSVSGSLVPGPLTLTADQFFSERLQGIVFGSGLTTFRLNLTTNFIAGSGPDSFGFYLLNSGLNPFTTSDPTGANALFVIDLTGATTAPQVFTSASAAARVAAPITSGIPEPATGVLVGAGLAASAALARRRTA